MSFPKVLMPYLMQNGLGINSDKIFGGIERFKKLVYENVPNVVPAEITEEQRKKRTGKGNLHFEIWSNQPDVIFINDASKIYGSDLIRYNLPTVWLCHEPLERTMKNVEMLKAFEKFTNSGGHLYFVSQRQHEFFDAQSKRILGHTINNVKGYINSSCCSGTEQVYPLDREFDAVTIGRTIRSKDPFWLHRKTQNTNLKTAVITGANNILKNPKEKDYFEFNLKWQEPQYTFRGLSHSDTLNTMSKGGILVSTWPLESWGITALEALSHGLPVLMITDTTNKHASQQIAASDTHYRCIRRGISSKELEKIINEMNEISLTDRQNIAKMTQEKHSLEKFTETMNKVFRDVL